MRQPGENLRCVSFGIGLCLMLLNTGVYAQTTVPNDVPAVQLGQCELPVDPLVQRDELWFLTCANARYGWEQVFVGASPDENGKVRFAAGYLGFHLNRYVSFHGRGIARQYLPATEQTEASRVELPEMIVAQLGNPAFHKFRLLAGRMQLPFGVNYSRVMENYRLLEDRDFWQSPPHGVQAIYDNLRDVTVEVGIGTNEYSKKTIRQERLRRLAASVRSSIDFPALDGSRLIFSGYVEENGSERIGFGFVTVSGRGDLTQFEWVRLRLTPDDDDSRSDQMFRLGYLSNWRNKTRWAFQYDDLWRLRRSVIFGYDLMIHENLTLRNGLSFIKQLSPTEDYRYVFSMGLEAHL